MGIVKTPESVSLDAVRTIQLALYQDNVAVIEVTLPADVFEYLHNRRKRSLVQLEEESGKKLRLLVGKNLHPDAIELRCFDSKNREVIFAPSPTKKQTFAEKLGDKKALDKRHEAKILQPNAQAPSVTGEVAVKNEKVEGTGENKSQEKAANGEDRSRRGNKRRRKQFAKKSGHGHHDNRDQKDTRNKTTGKIARIKMFSVTV